MSIVFEAARLVDIENGVVDALDIRAVLAIRDDAWTRVTDRGERIPWPSWARSEIMLNGWRMCSPLPADEVVARWRAALDLPEPIGGLMRDQQRGADARSSEGKGRIDAGIRVEEHDHHLRPYYCRHCGVEVRADITPVGWYSVQRAPGTPTEKAQRLGLYCSLACLGSELPRLEGIEQSLGDGWQDATAPYRQR